MTEDAEEPQEPGETEEPGEEEDGEAKGSNSEGDDDSVEASLEELLNRKERKGKLAEDDDEDALLEAIEDRDSRSSESLTVKVVPPQPTEFTCRGCFLLKHRSQLRDPKGMLCNDCA